MAHRSHLVSFAVLLPTPVATDNLKENCVRSSIVALLVLGSTLLSPLVSAQTDDESLAVDHRGTFAIPLERTAPRYPQSALRSGDQGWVRLSFVVNEEGEVVDPVVVDSSGDREFERAAKRTTESWSYEPATWDGETVQQCENEVMITFAIESSEAGVRRPFYRQYRRASEALDEDNTERAEELLEQMSTRAMTTYERARYRILQARLADAYGDDDARLRHLRRAVASGGRWIDEETYVPVLYVILVLELEAGDYSAALRTWDALNELDTTGIDLTQAAAAIEFVQEAIAGPDILAMEAQLEADEGCEDCTADWIYRPLRNSFAFSEIDGDVENLEIRCQRQRVVDDVSEDKTWQIPDSWGDCSILVFGEPGTTFKLLEIPG